MRTTQRVSIAISCALLAALPLVGAKFYSDDPIEKEPSPLQTVDAEVRGFSSVLEYFSATFGTPGERHPDRGVIPAQGVNTLGDVYDSLWYRNRHAKKRMSLKELEEGPEYEQPPSMDGPWRALTVKRFGERPGILIRDSKDDFYLLRFDPRKHLEMATGAEIVASNAFYALGYFVADSHIVYFHPEQLQPSEEGEDISSQGIKRQLEPGDIERVLRDAAKDDQGRYRAVATALGNLQGYKLLGPFQVFGQRSDDPNDIIPHEHRRDLRGLAVFSAWLNHSRFQAINTLDILGDENGVQVIQHFLVDFVTTLGSAGDRPKRARDGNEPLFEKSYATKNLVSFGVRTPKWMRAKFPKIRSVGRFEYETFDPEKWVTDQDIAPFANRLPDDEYWAAKQLMAFTDADIEALVKSGRYTDPRAEDWLTECLSNRRDTIGRTYFNKVLPLDHFKVEGSELKFEDLGVKHGFAQARDYQIQWSRFDNEKEEHSDIGIVMKAFELPSVIQAAPEDSYFAAKIWAGDPKMATIAYLRKEGSGFGVVGVERTWPEKVIADPSKDKDTGTNRYADLALPQRQLFDGYAKEYNEQTDQSLAPDKYFDAMTISERTTYDAITHALMNSKLTDDSGNSLGNALELVKSIERVAGQYYGRGGDQQFRIYVNLHPGTPEKLEKSQEFLPGHENTVYHVGYPHSFRQGGKPPTIQFSLSEDALKADLDVDYRTSKSPQAIWNGHLTSANSDVRSGENYDLHNNGWAGFVAWWRGIFGDLPDEDQGARDLLSFGPPVGPTELPANRPLGARIEKVTDANQEFLTDWLVRRNYEEALDFLADSSLACMNVDDDAAIETLSSAQARAQLGEIMRGVSE